MSKIARLLALIVALLLIACPLVRWPAVEVPGRIEVIAPGGIWPLFGITLLVVVLKLWPR